MTNASKSSSLVRILTASGDVVGGGYLAAPGRIITCAHVIADAIEGCDESQDAAPQHPIQFDFPMLDLAQDMCFTASVIEWFKVDDDARFNRLEDIAVLEISDVVQLPPMVVHIPSLALERDRLERREVSICGFPVGHDYGDWIDGKLKGLSGPVRVQLDTELGRRTLDGGYSGTPVWDAETHLVLGIVVAEDKRNGDSFGYMIPVEAIARAWPELNSYCVKQDIVAGSAKIDSAQWEIARQAIKKMRSNLRRDRGEFIGNADRYTKPIELLRQHNLLSLHGSPGCGKTRLSEKMADVLWRHYPDGVWIIDFSVTQTPQLVLARIADEMELETGGQATAAIIVNAVEDGHVLIIFDNCEQVYDECVKLSRLLLKKCRNLSVLLTSREFLNELTCFQVPLLELPPADVAAISIDKLQSYEAVKVFVYYARAVNSGFELNARNAYAVVSICRQLDGVPFEIRLAALQMKNWSAMSINEQLINRFDVLKQGGNKNDRQHSLKSMLEWSYNHFTGDEQLLLKLLSVFSGTWDRNAVSKVCHKKSLDKKINQVIDQLISKGFVERYQKTLDEARFYLLRSVRGFAEKKLKKKEAGEVKQRHMQYYLEVFLHNEQVLKGGDQRNCMELAELDHENSLSAIDWVLENREHIASGIRMAGAMRRFWFLRGHYQIGLNKLNALLAQAGDLKFTEDGVHALLGAGILARELGELDEAENFLKEALLCNQKINSGEKQSAIQNALGILYLRKGNVAAAETNFQGAYDIAVRINDKNLQAWTLNGLGNVAMEKKPEELDKATECYELSKAIKESIHDERGVAMSLFKLGDIAMLKGENEIAKNYYATSLGIRQALSYQAGIAASCSKLAKIALLEHNVKEAAKHYFSSVQTLTAIGEKLAIARILVSCVDMAIDLEAHEQAAFIKTVAESLYAQLEISVPAMKVAESTAKTKAAIARAQIKPWRENLAEIKDWLCTVSGDAA